MCHFIAVTYWWMLSAGSHTVRRRARFPPPPPFPPRLVHSTSCLVKVITRFYSVFYLFIFFKSNSSSIYCKADERLLEEFPGRFAFFANFFVISSFFLLTSFFYVQPFYAPSKQFCLSSPWLLQFLTECIKTYECTMWNSPKIHLDDYLITFRVAKHV